MYLVLSAFTSIPIALVATTKTSASTTWTSPDGKMDHNFDIIDQHLSDMVTTDMSLCFYTHKEEYYLIFISAA